MLFIFLLSIMLFQVRDICVIQTYIVFNKNNFKAHTHLHRQSFPYPYYHQCRHRRNYSSDHNTDILSKFLLSVNKIYSKLCFEVHYISLKLLVFTKVVTDSQFFHAKTFFIFYSHIKYFTRIQSKQLSSLGQRMVIIYLQCKKLN